ncbi:MAG: 2'-5' RNA ligase family protein [Chloroflexi bacterium]|nr:2'-5' RNA ligase family protein [Chloroflexota bacterium]
MTSSRYAVYLIPPYPISRDIAEIQALLAKQFGLKAANRFQVHATIKGFFKKTPGPLAPLIQRLDTVFATQKPFTVQFSGYRYDEIGIGLSLRLRDGKPNLELQAFREQVVKAVLPFIAPDCDFAAADLGPPYHAHITLAFRDIPPELYDHVFAWLADAPLPTGSFPATTFHFLEFFSEQWHGPWWEDLQWRLLKSWQLNP